MTTLALRPLRLVCAAVGLCILASNALADGAAAGSPPANDVHLGLYSVFYHASADDLSGPYVPGGVNLDVKNLETLYMAYFRRLSTHFQTELAIGWPPNTQTVGKGPATLGSVPYNGQVISKARWLAPSLLLEYVFFDDSHALRPYVGAGVTYASFYDRQSTAAGNAASGGPTKLELTSSVGATGTLGVAYRWSRNWGAYVSYSFADVHSHLAADTAGVIRTTKISFNPQALVVAVGYAF